MSEEPLELSQINDFYGYLDALAALEHSTIAIAACDTITPDLEVTNISTTGYVQLWSLGLRLLRADNIEQQFWAGYAAIIHDGRCIFENLAGENENVRYESTIDGHLLKILSSPAKNRNYSFISLDGTERDVKGRGLNIVVFDEFWEQLDSVCFDTWNPKIPSSRKKRDRKPKEPPAPRTKPELVMSTSAAERSEPKVERGDSTRSSVPVEKSTEDAGRHYDIALLGVWSGCNYGSIATYYALNRVISDMGYSVLMVDKPAVVNDDIELKMNHSRAFANKHYNISKSYKLSELGELNNYCDAFVLGSDQLWNYGISKGYGKAYYLDFVEPGKKKVSYGTSFGHAVDFAPEEERPAISKLMSDFDAISVREADGVKICRESYHINAVQVLDPVFLAGREIFDELADESRFEERERYVATYILDPTPEKVQLAQNVSGRLGCKLVNVLDGLPWLFKKNKEKLGLDAVEDVRVEEWLGVIRGSELLITDSCHGASFGLVFHRRIIAIKNKRRGFSRFNSLGDLFDIQDRILTDPLVGIGNDALLEDMDYDAIDAKLTSERTRCGKWLKDALTLPKEELPPVRMAHRSVDALLDRTMCMGCGACVSACPKDALALKPDKLGYYRSTIDWDACIDCGRCARVCPAIKLPANSNSAEPACYEFQAADEHALESSSSGGAFPVLAREAIRRGGKVFGAAWRDDLTVAHVMIDCEEDLPRLQKSKYLQSYLGTTYRQVKAELDAGSFVLFSGCPCQVAGLRAYLGGERENLLAVDLLCGNSPSAGFFQRYLEDSFHGEAASYEFRHKSQGWNCTCVEVVLKDGSRAVYNGPKEDAYQRVYHTHVMCAPHCEQCRYQALPRFGDLTIGDFWGVGKRDRELDTSKGISVVLCNSERGRAFLDALPKDELGVFKEVPLSWLGGNGYALPGAHNFASPRRDKFYQVVADVPFSRAVDYALTRDSDLTSLPYGRSTVSLAYDQRIQRFSYDSSVWEPCRVEGFDALRVKPGRSRVGRYAVMPLTTRLVQGRRYRLITRFHLRTESRVLNFHVKDSSSTAYQVIYSYKRASMPDEVVDVSAEFVADSDAYDEFMIGASQVKGEGNFIAFEYISICEVPNESEVPNEKKPGLWKQVKAFFKRF